jgi:hypothetical protein
VGGLVGTNARAGRISQSFSTDQVDATDSPCGGLVADNQGSISQSYSTGNTRCGEYTGGLVGYNEGSGTISQAYSTGTVAGPGSQLGGLVAVNANPSGVTASFWDVTTSGQTTSAGGTGELTSAMQAEGTFTAAGWDFATGWAIHEGTSYPYL